MEINKVVVPVDFTSTTDKVVDYAVSVAEKLGAEICFLHVVSDFEGYDMMLVHPSFNVLAADMKEKSENRIAELVETYAGSCGNVEIGDAAEKIVEYAKNEGADMIIVGTHGAKGLERIILGSTAERVIKKASCPVLTFNPLQ
jgi:nucleotide-binding universal stress UspA family protein